MDTSMEIGAKEGVLLVGVPFSSTGRCDGIAQGIHVLRGAGLVNKLASGMQLYDGGDLQLEGQRRTDRGLSGLVNEQGLAALIEQTRSVVTKAHAGGCRPLLVGGDCPVILGALAALQDLHGRAALVMVDGHEDAWPPHASPTGEASDSELGIALGLVDSLPEQLQAVSGVVEPHYVALLGTRDADELRRYGIGSLTGSVGFFADFNSLRSSNPTGVADRAIAKLGSHVKWWLHIDLDVLREQDFPAADYQQPGGLAWAELVQLSRRLWLAPGCAGASIVIYNAELGPGRSVARRTVAFIADVLQGPYRVTK